LIDEFEQPRNKVSNLLKLYRGSVEVEQTPPSPPRARTFHQLTSIDPMPEARHVRLDPALVALRVNTPLTRLSVAGALTFILEITALLRQNGESLGGPTRLAATERRELQLVSDQTLDRLIAGIRSHAGKLLRTLQLYEQVAGDRTGGTIMPPR